MSHHDAMSGQLRAGKYLTFVLAGEEYGLEILRVREIICMLGITKLPQMPDFVRGVINLRGKVVPVVDLRLKFGMSQRVYDEKTCIIVVDIGCVEMGIVVDKVSEVLDITAEQIDETPRFGIGVSTEFILGMGKIGDQVTILLDISKIFTTEEKVTLQNSAQT